MSNHAQFTDLSIEKRLDNGALSVEELFVRSHKERESRINNLPEKRGEHYGCPVCFSIMGENNRLVVYKQYVACDYCVNYIEDYIKRSSC